MIDVASPSFFLKISLMKKFTVFANGPKMMILVMKGPRRKIQ